MHAQANQTYAAMVQGSQQHADGTSFMCSLMKPFQDYSMWVWYNFKGVVPWVFVIWRQLNIFLVLNITLGV